jgi:hypothetical protein
MRRPSSWRSREKRNDFPALRERAKREGQVWVLARSPLSVGGRGADLAEHRVWVPLNRQISE